MNSTSAAGKRIIPESLRALAALVHADDSITKKKRVFVGTVPDDMQFVISRVVESCC
jgi:hypothetical protein